MAPPLFRDVVVVLPGITGSVLTQNGQEVWGFSVPVLWNAIRSFGGSIQDLELGDDDPEIDDLGDGVKATRVIHRAHSWPGLHKNVGYGPLLDRLRRSLGTRGGSGSGTNAGNFFEFAYDWRRDNRVAARQLKRLIDERLPAWQATSGAQDAKVILVAHSMGGIVSRYYLECLGGWERCRALFSFGTPYRGAPNSLNYLANGDKKMSVDISALMRSFTSVYQLLPRYEVMKVGEQMKRVGDVSVPNVDVRRVASASDFHQEIDAGVEQRPADGYLIEPIVGLYQPTMTTASVVDGRCVVSRDVPIGVSEVLLGGDGTVPRISATPIELSTQARETFVAERHSALQVSGRVLDQVVDKMMQLQAVGDLDRIRSGFREDVGRLPAISLDIGDAFSEDEPVTIRAQTINYVETPISVTAEVSLVANPDQTRSVRLNPVEDGYEGTLENMQPGTYAITVETSEVFPVTASPVHDLFEVLGPAEP